MTIDAVSAIATTGPSVAGALPGGKMGKDEFLKMLVAQLRHQDPLEPMDGDQMAAQLAQFSTVEQLSSISSLLATQNMMTSALAQTIHDTSAASLIGRSYERTEGKTNCSDPLNCPIQLSASTACRESGTMCSRFIFIFVAVIRHRAASKSMSRHSA